MTALAATASNLLAAFEENVKEIATWLDAKSVVLEQGLAGIIVIRGKPTANRKQLSEKLQALLHKEVVTPLMEEQLPELRKRIADQLRAAAVAAREGEEEAAAAAAEKEKEEAPAEEPADLGSANAPDAAAQLDGMAAEVCALEPRLHIRLHLTRAPTRPYGADLTITPSRTAASRPHVSLLPW